MILDELAGREQESTVIAALIDIAADWDAFHLAADEYQARATVQKAREMKDAFADYVQREDEARDVRRLARRKSRRQNTWRYASSKAPCCSSSSTVRLWLAIRKPAAFFSMIFSIAFLIFTASLSPNRSRAMRVPNRSTVPFARDGWHYLVECRWRAKLVDTRDLDGLLGQIGRSGRQTDGCLPVDQWLVSSCGRHAETKCRQNGRLDGRL